MATVCLALVCCTHAAPPPRIPEGWVNLVGGNSKRTPTVLQYTKKENNFDDFASGIVQVPTALDLLKARLILTEANHVEKRLPPSAIRLSPAAGLKPCSRRSSSNTISSELTLCSTFNAFNRSFALELSRITSLFHNGAQFTAVSHRARGGGGRSNYSATLEVDVGDRGRWLSGKVAGEPESEVRLTAVHDLFYGAVHTAKNGTYVIELVADNSVNKRSQTQAQYSMYMYNARTMVPHAVKRGCDTAPAAVTHAAEQHHHMPAAHGNGSDDGDGDGGGGGGDGDGGAAATDNNTGGALNLRHSSTKHVHSPLPGIAIGDQDGSGIVTPTAKAKSDRDRDGGQDNDGVGEHYIAVQRRDGAGAPPPPPPSVCELFLDADQTFLDQWGGDHSTYTLSQRVHRATLKMIDVIYQVDGIYSKPSNLGEKLTLKIIGSMIHTGVYFDARGNTGILQTYQEWLGTHGPKRCNGPNCVHYPRGLELPSADDACLNHLFTHTDAGGVLGVAIQASPTTRISGGLCDKMVKINGDYLAVNTAFSNTKGEDDQPVPTWQSMLSAAHELGHNLGANHDCSLVPGDSAPFVAECKGTTSQCFLPDELGGPFLMYPAIGQDVSGVNSRLLSDCSYGEIIDVIGTKGTCLKQLHAEDDGTGNSVGGDGDDVNDAGGDGDSDGGGDSYGEAGGVNGNGHTIRPQSCTYFGNQSTSCSEPCGGGTRVTVAASCSCTSGSETDAAADPAQPRSAATSLSESGGGVSSDNGGIGTHVSIHEGAMACDIAMGPFQITSCSEGVCKATTASSNVSAIVSVDHSLFEVGAFEVLVTDVLGWPVRVTRLAVPPEANTSYVELQSCRTDGTVDQCISTTELSTALEAVSSTLAATVPESLGYTLSFVGERNLFAPLTAEVAKKDDTPWIAVLIVASVIIVVVVAWMAYTRVAGIRKTPPTSPELAQRARVQRYIRALARTKSGDVPTGAALPTSPPTPKQRAGVTGRRGQQQQQQLTRAQMSVEDLEDDDFSFMALPAIAMQNVEIEEEYDDDDEDGVLDVYDGESMPLSGNGNGATTSFFGTDGMGATTPTAAAAGTMAKEAGSVGAGAGAGGNAGADAGFNAGYSAGDSAGISTGAGAGSGTRVASAYTKTVVKESSPVKSVRTTSPAGSSALLYGGSFTTVAAASSSSAATTAAVPLPSSGTQPRRQLSRKSALAAAKAVEAAEANNLDMSYNGEAMVRLRQNVADLLGTSSSATVVAAAAAGGAGARGASAGAGAGARAPETEFEDETYTPPEKKTAMLGKTYFI